MYKMSKMLSICCCCKDKLDGHAVQSWDEGDWKTSFKVIAFSLTGTEWAARILGRVLKRKKNNIDKG